MKFLQKLFQINFGLNVFIRTERIEKGEKLFYINPTNKVVYRFLTKVFGLPAGPKSNIVEVPRIILQSQKEIKKWFICGVFDADGDTRAVEAGFKPQSRVKLRMKSKKFIYGMKKLLEKNFKVSVNGPYVDVKTGASYIQIEKQKDIISLAKNDLFYHPIKRWRLNKTKNFLLSN